MNEITEATFVNLANNLIGTGLLNTGKVNYELALDLAKQETIRFTQWMSNFETSTCFDEDGNISEVEIIGGKDAGKSMGNIGNAYKLYQQSKKTNE